ncbi:MAG: glycosyltransferase [Patescibacteria group bacterium]
MAHQKKIKICCVVSVDMTLKFMLINQLQFLVKEGYKVHAISSPGKWIKDMEEKGIKVKTIEITRKMFTPISDLLAFLKMFFYFKKEKFDIVHTHTLKPEFYGQIAAKMAGVPIILNTIHGLDFGDYTSPFRKNIFIFLERMAAKCSNLIFSVSRHVIEVAVRENISKADKFFYLGRDIDTERFNPGKFSEEFIRNKKMELGINPDKKIIGIVARLVAEKGYLDLFKAMQKVVLSFPDVLLLVVGQEEPQKKDGIRKNIVKEYNIENNVKFLDERTDVELLYPVMDIFVLPTHREGIGAAILEASAMEKAVIATKVGGCVEAVENGQTGLLIPLGDVEKLAESIKYLLSNPDISARMGKAGREKILREFKMEIVLNRLGKQYENLISRKLSDIAREGLEARWEREVDELFIEKGEEASHLVEKNWKNYLNYFLVYFKPHIKKDNSKTLLLDAGCGPGFALNELSRHGFKAYGIDFSRKMIDFAKSRHQDINFQRSSVYNMPFENEMFDMVICLGVFQTITDHQKALSEMSRVLKRGGILIVRTLNKLSFSYFQTKKDNPYYFFYNPFAFKKEMEKKGLKVLSIKGIYLFPKKFHFLMDLTLKTNLYKLFNLLFLPIFVFFAHSFYIEAIKE